MSGRGIPGYSRGIRVDSRGFQRTSEGRPASVREGFEWTPEGFQRSSEGRPASVPEGFEWIPEDSRGLQRTSEGSQRDSRGGVLHESRASSVALCPGSSGAGQGHRFRPAGPVTDGLGRTRAEVHLGPRQLSIRCACPICVAQSAAVEQNPKKP